MSVTTDTAKTGVGAFSIGTWANRPATQTNGALYFATDVGENGSLLQSNGTRWRALNGASSLKTLGAASANIANSETIVLQSLIPAGSWQTNDTLRIWMTASKSGATDVGNLWVRVGTAGTTADTAITGLSTASILSAAALSGGWMFDIKLLSSTSVQRVGVNGASLPTYAGASTSAAYAATTVTDASTNALYVSVGIASGGATNTVAMASGQIQLITP